MPAPTVLAPTAHGKAPVAVPGVPGPGREPTATDVDNGSPPVDFASLLVAQAPAGDDFAALQAVKAALDQEAADAAELPSDIGALLAEITQPLAPTTVPLAPVAVPAASLGAVPVEVDGRPLAAPALPAELRPESAKLATDAGGLTQTSEGNAPAPPEFKLPETPPLAHALAGSAHAQGATSPNAPAAPANLVAAQPIHSPQWSGEVGQGLVWMARNEIQTAQLAINPPQLGPIEITLSINKDQATAYFASPHADVREVLQEALPRLREILEGAGVQLGQADVGDQTRQQFTRQNERGRENVPAFGLEHASFPAEAAVNMAGPVRHRMGRGLVDTFV